MPTASTSSAGKQAQSENISPQGPPNPFFGTRVIKRAPPVHVKDDFNPFKHHKVTEAAQVAPTWPHNDKRYMWQMFPPSQVQPQQPSPPMAPPGSPPPMPPATYEEDHAAQAARGGYMYAYPQYYPG